MEPRLTGKCARVVRGLGQLRRNSVVEGLRAGALDGGFGGGFLGLAGRGTFEGVGQGSQVGAGAGLDDVGGDAGAGGQDAVGADLAGDLAEGVVAAGDRLDRVFGELALDSRRLFD